MSLAYGAREPADHDVGGCARVGDPDPPHLTPSSRGDRGAGSAKGPFVGRFEKGFTGGRQPHGAGAALEELCAELPFELADGPADRRLGQVELLGGPSEVELLSDGEEHAQLLDLHDAHGTGRELWTNQL